MSLLTPIPSPQSTVHGLPLLLGQRPSDTDLLLEAEIEDGITLREVLRILLAGMAGKRSGLGTATELYMAQDGTTPRITFTPTDDQGNGTTVVDGS